LRTGLSRHAIGYRLRDGGPWRVLLPALLRMVIAEATDGVRSAPEAELRDLVIKARMPLPLFNPRLYLPSGGRLNATQGQDKAGGVRRIRECRALARRDIPGYFMTWTTGNAEYDNLNAT
jgi:hypothetical protein